MSNDENKSLQQNLPLSWEEDSQDNLEEQAPPKKLLLRREENQTDSFKEEYESDTVPKPEAPKPLLLKRSAEEPQQNDDEYRREQDSQDTIYDREIPTEPSEYEEDEEYDEDEWQEDDSELEEESSELENETDSFGVVENELDDDFDLGDAEDKSDDDDESLETDADNEELASESVDDEDTEDLESENSEESESGDELPPLEDEYASTFEDSGTFTLDESNADDEPTPLFEEDDIVENRLEISEDGITSNSSSEEESDDSSEEESDDSSEEDTPSDQDISEEASKEQEDSQEEMTAEESVFALKADTYYEVQTEVKAEGEPEENEETAPAEVIQDYDIQSLGSLLQEARLSCSFTIKDAAEATRIKSSYIIALENNEMDELPAKVYILNYIRQLCREYNVPNEPMLEAFERQNEKNSNGADVKIMRVGDEDARKATKPNSKLNALVIGTSLLTLTMLFLIAWYMRWFNPVATPDTIKIEINLEEVRPEVKLPAPELPIPSQ